MAVSGSQSPLLEWIALVVRGSCFSYFFEPFGEIGLVGKIELLGDLSQRLVGATHRLTHMAEPAFLPEFSGRQAKSSFEPPIHLANAQATGFRQFHGIETAIRRSQRVADGVDPLVAGAMDDWRQRVRREV